jgi:hypothetical protein
MSEKVPKNMQTKHDEVVALTDQVCKAHLNEEYAELARKLAAKLARKRPSPLVSGQAKSWACGIVYALGQVNFLFDSSQDPHIPAAELCALFGVATSTGSNKAKTVRDAAKLSWYNSEWMLADRVAESPMVWMISVNGIIVDARRVPFSLQLEAYQKKLIPYIPGADMEEIDRLIKEHGYLRVIELPNDLDEEDSGTDENDGAP